jgi:regulator of protease activity HflC (stomatin/prohibitin superfamily)
MGPVEGTRGMLEAILLGVGGFVVAWTVLGVRVVNQFERGIIFRFGRALPQAPPNPGLALMIPIVDRLKKINVQIVTLPVPAQEGITRDNVSVKVDAVVYFRVDDPVKALIEVQNYQFAVAQVAQTSLRSIIGKSELDDLLSNREQLHRGLELLIDSPALGWGIHIDRVEIKDVQLPESMKRSMSRQAEAEAERRARIITADGEYQAAQKLADASAIMAETPGALQLAAAADRRRGGGGEELDAGDAVPRRDVAVLRTDGGGAGAETPDAAPRPGKAEPDPTRSWTRPSPVSCATNRASGRDHAAILPIVTQDVWASGEAYETYMGRWSPPDRRAVRHVAGRTGGAALARRRVRHRRADGHCARRRRAGRDRRC